MKLNKSFEIKNNVKPKLELYDYKLIWSENDKYTKLVGKNK